MRVDRIDFLLLLLAAHLCQWDIGLVAMQLAVKSETFHLSDSTYGSRVSGNASFKSIAKLDIGHE